MIFPAARFFLRVMGRVRQAKQDISQALLMLHHTGPYVRELESAIESAVLFCQVEGSFPKICPTHSGDSRHIPCFIRAPDAEEIEARTIKQCSNHRRQC